MARFFGQNLPVDVVVWRRSIFKTLFGVVVSAVLAAGGAAMGLGWFADDGVYPRVIGWFGAACAVFAGFQMVRQLIRTGPVIEVGAAGFHDWRLSAVPIPWECIDEIRVRVIGRRRFLLIEAAPSVQEEYVHSSADSRLALTMTRVNGGLLIATPGLDRPFDDLVAAVQRWHPITT